MNSLPTRSARTVHRPFARLLVLLAAVVTLGLPSRAHADWPARPEPTDHTAQNKATVEQNRFVTYRRTMHTSGADGYDVWHGQGLLEDMRTWHEGMTVLDAGAGTAGMFADVVENARTGRSAVYQPKTLPRMIAASAARPRAVDTYEWQGQYAYEGTRALAEGVRRLDAALEAPGQKLTYLEGRFGEAKYPLEHQIGLGTVDRIVEVFGPSHYTEHYDRVLRGYGMLLRPGGQLRLHFDTNHLSFRDAEGHSMEVEDYLRSIGGLRVVSTTQPTRFDQYVAVVLERTGGRLRVPTLETEDFEIEPGWTAPTRAYRVASRRAAASGTRAARTARPARSGLLGGAHANGVGNRPSNRVQRSSRAGRR